MRRLGCIILFAIVALASPAGAADRVGEVIALIGECAADGARGHRILSAGTAIDAGDTIGVAKGGRLKLRLADGSVLSLAEGTRLTVEAFAARGTDGRDARLGLSSGLVRAVVSRMAQPSRFEVGTATAVAAVRSTDWFIEARPEWTRVGVLIGRVGFTSNATHKTVEIPDRFGSRVEPGKDPVEPRIWSQPEFDEYVSATALP